jgi:hypothetical protein
MPNNEMSGGEGQRKEVYYTAKATTGRGTVSTSAIFRVQNDL